MHNKHAKITWLLFPVFVLLLILDKNLEEKKIPILSAVSKIGYQKKEEG